MLTQKKMLLVDGDEGVRKSLSLFFGSHNCRLHAVENAKQAIIAIKNELYDVIICDELLPDMNGILFFETINNRCFEGIKILVTLYGNSTTFEDIREKGIDYLLTKPFSGDEVESAVTDLIKARHIKNGSDNSG